ncbi:pyridoxine/pyridoxamine 5'-phosphate oxidase [Cellvibrio mixtus]|uniref:pyridoxine/pyridoxamine 5'-phosphate oxidase n=1 Tax=Cellvibrio mixtus TaxID=39650 RepID=UPI000586B181|nr:pyridoxal 5'-phosphate synthase [Cellvibrio mixtus]
MENPIEKFQSWWNKAISNSPLQQKSAICISTIDEHGFPSGRFVDLKSVDENGFVFCSYLDSAKGKHIEQNPKVAMTLWWDHIGYQVRVIGEAKTIDDAEAVEIWKTRKRSAQLITTAFQQSQPLMAQEELQTRLQTISEQFIDKDVRKPPTWGGYRIKPLSIEFLTFAESRLHLRELFTRKENIWIKSLLQP